MRILTNYDFTLNEIQNVKIQNLASDPSSSLTSANKGFVYFNTTTNRLYVWDGVKFVGADAVDAMMSGDDIIVSLNASSLKIDDNNLSTNVNNAIAMMHNTHAISDVTGLRTALDSKATTTALATLSATVDGKAPTAHTHTIANVTSLQTALDGKASTSHNHTLDSLSNTTITSIASGEILKWNGTAWVNNTLAEAGIAASSHSHTIGNVTGLQTALDGKVDDSQVLTNVPAGAVFTDTVYTHPTSHAPSIITQDSSNRFVTDAQITAWNAKGSSNLALGTTSTTAFRGDYGNIAYEHSQVAHAPSNANYYEHPTGDGNLHVPATGTTNNGKVLKAGATAGSMVWGTDNDTITTVNGKTGAISKADITALGIPAQDTTYSVFTSTVNGLAPSSGGGTSKYLRSDGTWATPPNTVYTLPVAGTSIGGVKSGTDITVDASGNVSIVDDSHNHIISNIDGLQTALDSKETPAGASSKASTAESNAKTYTDTKLAELLDSAPAALDTLNELSAALGNDPNFATTITNSIALKTDRMSVAIGNASLTTFTVTHGFNSRDVVVAIRETASPYAQVITDVEMTTLDTITVKFAVAPTLNQYTVTVIG